MAGSPRPMWVWRARMTLKMASRNSWRARRLVFLAALFLPCCLAQTNVLSVAPPEKVVARHGGPLEGKKKVLLQPGYHLNTNTTRQSNLIPLRLPWLPRGHLALEGLFSN